MKQLLITTIAAVVLVGCGPSVDIWTAAKEGNIEVVKQHLDAGTDVNAKDEYGWTSLHEAARKGHKEIVELLIAKGADVNAKDSDGRTPADSSISIMIDLLRKHGGKTGADLSIHKAAEQGNIEAVTQHLAAGANVNAKDEDSKTPLLHAAVDGHKDVVELLIAKGADIELRCTTCGGTALGHAASGGHKEIIELLIEKGADVNAKDENSLTPLDLAIIYKSSRNRMLAQLAHSEIADLLRKHGAKHGTIYGAAAGGDIEAVKVFLANDMDVNARPKYGDSALVHAVRGGSRELVELLISEGADVNLKNEVGATVLDLGSGKIHADIVNLLRKHGGKTRNELIAKAK
jgi:cytohesin